MEVQRVSTVCPLDGHGDFRDAFRRGSGRHLKRGVPAHIAVLRPAVGEAQSDISGEFTNRIRSDRLLPTRPHRSTGGSIQAVIWSSVRHFPRRVRGEAERFVVGNGRGNGGVEDFANRRAIVREDEQVAICKLILVAHRANNGESCGASDAFVRRGLLEFGAVEQIDDCVLVHRAAREGELGGIGGRRSSREGAAPLGRDCIPDEQHVEPVGRDGRGRQGGCTILEGCAPCDGPCRRALDGNPKCLPVRRRSAEIVGEGCNVHRLRREIVAIHVVGVDRRSGRGSRGADARGDALVREDRCARRRYSADT